MKCLFLCLCACVSYFLFIGDADPCKINNGGCAHSCHQGPNGTAECLCEKGFKVVNEGHMCVGKKFLNIYLSKLYMNVKA